MIRCIIVDDEPLARQLLESYIVQLTGISCVATCSSATEAFSTLHQQQVDVIFLDIQMPGITGLNFLKSLRSYPKVIFTTAYPNYAVEAFELEAVDYLVKPITFERFAKAIQKITAKAEEPVATASGTEENPHLFLKVNKRLIKIDHKDVLYAESLGDYLKVYTPTQTFVSYMTLSKLEGLLPANQFVRIHRSTLVNLSHVQYVEGNVVRIQEKDLSVGLTYKNNLAKKLSGLPGRR
ncbi:MAG: LytTR family DNA-binding domain-containing protein [Chitinophagaceae bacterium]